MGSNYGPAPVHGPEHRHLEAFVGTWRAEGQSFGRNQDAANPRANPEPWMSHELTEWHPGRFFIIQREDAMVGDQPLNTHAIIGYDALAGEFVVHAFENHGFANRYALRRENRTWTLSGERERATIEFSEDGRRQTVRWEWRPFDDQWLPLCDRTNVKLR